MPPVLMMLVIGLFFLSKKVAVTVALSWLSAMTVGLDTTKVVLFASNCPGTDPIDANSGEKANSSGNSSFKNEFFIFFPLCLNS